MLKDSLQVHVKYDAFLAPMQIERDKLEANLHAYRLEADVRMAAARCLTCESHGSLASELLSRMRMRLESTTYMSRNMTPHPNDFKHTETLTMNGSTLGKLAASNLKPCLGLLQGRLAGHRSFLLEGSR